VSKVAYSASITFIAPGKTHMNKEVTIKNTAITMYPINDVKNERISFLSSANIVL